MLLHESAGSAYKCPFMCFHDQTINLAAVLTLILLDIFLCFRQFVLLCFDFSLALILSILLILLAILLLKKRGHSYVILSSLMVFT